jgi:uncharacterized membrane protein YdjX (TVP38/TMEM64 family)
VEGGVVKKDIVRKAAVLAVLGVLLAVFQFYHLGQYLTLSYIKASQTRFAALYAGEGALVISMYAAFYILVTSLSLPGAAVLTLAGGALFGLWTGTLVVSFASTIGATLACAASRFVLRDWVQERFRDRIARINEGIEREGAFYLFTLRLIPLFPFWLINLAMGVTKMRLVTFYWVSQAGMLAGTLVYVNAGKELAKIDSLSGIISPQVIGSFVLLGVFPLIAKRIIAWLRKRKGAGRAHTIR